MDLSTLNRGTGGPVGRPRTDAILTRLPKPLREKVAAAESAAEALKKSAPKPPEDASSVVMRLAAESNAAALAKDTKFDLSVVCAEAVIAHDADALAYEVGRAAVSAANAHVVNVLRAILPEAYDTWTATANDRLGDLKEALAGQPSLGDPLVEFRAGGARAKRAQTIEAIYADLDALAAAWRQGRVLQANGGPDPEAWDEHALFADDPREATAFAKAHGCTLWDALASTDTEVAFDNRDDQRQRLARIARERKALVSS